MAEEQVVSIHWVHDGDQCEAEVGQPMKWGRPDKRTQRVTSWKWGANVLRIYRDQYCWRVELEEPAGYWHNPIMCGDNVTVRRANRS